MGKSHVLSDRQALRTIGRIHGYQTKIADGAPQCAKTPGPRRQMLYPGGIRRPTAFSMTAFSVPEASENLVLVLAFLKCVEKNSPASE